MAHVGILCLDAMTAIDHCIQIVARLGADLHDPDYKPGRHRSFNSTRTVYIERGRVRRVPWLRSRNLRDFHR